MLIPFHLYFGSKYRILPSRRKPRHTTLCLFWMLRLQKKTFRLPPRICTGLKHNRYERNVWGVEKRQFLSIFKEPLASPTLEGSLYATPTNPTRSQVVNNGKFHRFALRSFSISMSSLCPADEIIDIWRTRLRSGTSISLTWSTFPNTLTSIVLRPTDFALKTNLKTFTFAGDFLSFLVWKLLKYS